MCQVLLIWRRLHDTIAAMDKATLIKRAGSCAAVARELGITTQAVSAWKTIPELRLIQLRRKKPSWFREPKLRADIDWGQHGYGL